MRGTSITRAGAVATFAVLQFYTIHSSSSLNITCTYLCFIVFAGLIPNVDKQLVDGFSRQEG